VLLIRELMVQNGDVGKPIWASEVGWNALPRGFDGFPYYGRVSEELQAEYSAGAYQRAQTEWPWMGVMSYWFFKRPSDHEKDQAFYYFRMMEPDFYPHPVYYALKEQATAPPVLGLGYHQEDHWALRYEGSWEDVTDQEAVLGGYRASANPDDSLSFTFWGTDLSLVPLRDAHCGLLEVTVDGRRALLDLCAHEISNASELSLARGLPEGTHEARLTVADAADTDGRVTIDGLIVRHSPAFLIRRGLAYLILASLTGALLYVGWRHWVGRGSPC
jgi:hypothetical protein